MYADLGAALVRTGARAAAVLAEILELAPFGKLLFSSGAHGLPELHVVGARLFREALTRVLGTWVAEGAWSPHGRAAGGGTDRRGERAPGVRGAVNGRETSGASPGGSRLSG